MISDVEAWVKSAREPAVKVRTRLAPFRIVTCCRGCGAFIGWQRVKSHHCRAALVRWARCSDCRRAGAA